MMDAPLKNHFYISGFLLVTVAYFLGCVKKPNSTVQTLDNLEANDPLAHPNSCDGGANNKNATDLYKGDNAAAKIALSAVPVAVQKDFFIDLKGTFEFSPNPLDACKKRLPKEVWDSLHSNTQGCWVYDEKVGVAVIVLGESPAAIQHDLVREFGFVYADFSARRKWAGKDVAISGEETNPIDYYLDSVAIAYLVDVFKHQGNFLSLKDRLAIDVSGNPNPGYDDIKKAYLALAPATRRVWSSKVTAEAFDNVFCSDETRNKLSEYGSVKSLALSLFADLGAQKLFATSTANKGPKVGEAAFATFGSLHQKQLDERREQGLDNGLNSMRDFARNLTPKTQELALDSNPVQLFLMARMLTTIFGGFIRGGGLGGVNPAMAPGFGGAGGVYPYPTYPYLYPTPYATIPAGTIPIGGGSPSVSISNGGTFVPAPSNLPEMVKQIVDATNQWRARLPNTPQLQVAADLSAECQLHAEMMVKDKMIQWAEMKHYPSSANANVNGENVAAGQANGYAAVFGTNQNIEDCRALSLSLMGWCNHAGHKENLENSGFHFIGVGYASDGGTNYWCQNFRF